MESALSDIILLLSSKNVNIQDVANDWFKKYPSWENGKRTFIELLFHSAGWTSFTYDSFMSLSFSTKTCHKGLISDAPLALDENFTKNFDKFLVYIFEQNFELTVLSSYDALKSIVRAVFELNCCGWNTFRLISAHTGTKLLTVMNGKDEPFQNKLEIARRTGNAGLASQMKIVQQRTDHLKKDLHSAFLCFLRDASPDVRLLAYSTMLVWAQEDPAKILEQEWHSYISFGLCEIPRGSEVMLRIVALLCNPNLNVQLQEALMENIASKVVYLMQDKRPFASTAMKILSTANRYLEFPWPSSLCSRINVHVFNPDKGIAVNAAEFVFYNLPQEVRQHPEKVLQSLVHFSHQSERKSEHILIDSFFGLLKTIVTWDHFLKLFSECEPEYVHKASLMFMSYVEQMTTSACPPGRSRKLVRTTKYELKCAGTEFTSFLAANWANLFRDRKIRLQPPALGAVISSVEFVNKTIPSSLALDMIVFLVNLLMTTDHCHLIKRSFSAMGHLRRTVVWSSAEERQVAGHCTLIEKQILADFVEYINAPVSTITCDEIEARMINSINFSILTNDDLVWTICSEKLRSIDFNGCNCQLVCAILRVLFAITIKLYVAVVDDLASATNCLVYSQDTDNDGSNHNVGLLIDRLHQLHYSLVAMIRGDIDHSIRILVFNILVEMVILFGNHKAAIKNDPGFVFFFNRLLPEVEPSIVHFAYETMECAADLEKCKSETDLSTAVDILKKICRLFEMGYIRFEPIGDFLALTGKIPEIDIFVHRVLESFVRRSPMMYKTVAIVIFKGILKVCEKSITNCRQVSNGSSSSTRLELAKDVKTVVDSWLHYDDFYQVWRKRHITATVKMMLELFARKSGCLEMEQLTVSVFDEPPQESDSRIHSIDNDSTTDDESSAVGTNRAQRAELVVAESVFSDKTRDDHSGTRDDHSGTEQKLKAMSAFQKSFLSAKLPPKSSMNAGRGNPSAKGRGIRGTIDYKPSPWNTHFDEKKDVVVNGNSFRVYVKGNAGPCLVLIHGGGFSALTWSLLTTALFEMVECQILAIDLRSHGDTRTMDDSDLSIETLTSDVVTVINLVVPEGTPIVLIGHSLGGSIAVHAGHHPNIQSLIGLIVIDVVEGTALGALSSMQSILRGRPQYFNSIEDAIKWSVQSGQVKNLESAKISMPGQIKNNKTGQTATAELEAESFHRDAAAQGAVSNSPILTVESISEDKEATFASPGAISGNYGWRIDLRATELHWSGWFQGLSKLFLSCPAQKLLLLASLDRLDTDLTVAQMQGKFEIHAFEHSRGRCGHIVHEDIPEAVAELIATYLVRNKFSTQKAGFQEGTIPCC